MDLCVKCKHHDYSKVTFRWAFKPCYGVKDKLYSCIVCGSIIPKAFIHRDKKELNTYDEHSHLLAYHEYYFYDSYSIN